MPDTGAPWNIPYAEPADLVRDWPALSEDVADAVAAGLTNANFDASEVIAASDASWPVPSLGSPIVKVTVIGGGGGGGSRNTDGTAGGNTTFTPSGGSTITGLGGALGRSSAGFINGYTGRQGFMSANEGGGASRANSDGTGSQGQGGQVVVAYVDMTGVTTANVAIGAGGNGGSGAGDSGDGGAGGNGVVIVEYKAA